MPTLQWLEIPFALESPVGSGVNALPFNAFLHEANPATHLADQAGIQWILETEGCLMGAAKRVVRDNIPQKSGEIIHRKFKGGMVAQVTALAVEVIFPASSGDVEFKPACGEDLVDLMDLMMIHLNSMENSDGRLLWLPTGKLARMLLDVRWLGSDTQGAGSSGVDVTDEDNNVFKAVTFTLLSPFPYAMNNAETDTHLVGGVPQVVDNTGTAGFYPVIRVNGPSSAFTILNTPALTGTTTELIYDSAFPGANPIPYGQYIEFDFFRETAYFNGSGANAKNGIDVRHSDFWALEVGNNTVEITGASAELLWQPAYAG